MNKYEIMFIVKATLESAEVDKTAANLKGVISGKLGKVSEFKALGEKKFAYPIKKQINGYYFLMLADAEPEAIAEFNKKALIDENILRHLVIKLDEKE